MSDLAVREQELLRGFDTLKIMIHNPAVDGSGGVTVVAGRKRQEAPIQLSPRAIAAVLAATVISLLSEEHPESVAEQAGRVWEHAISGDAHAAAEALRRMGIVIGRPWRLRDERVVLNLPAEIRKSIEPLAESSSPLTRVAVDLADNGVLIHLRRTRFDISPAEFVANAILEQNKLQREMANWPRELSPGLLAMHSEIQNLTEQIFSLLTAFLLDARMVLFVGPSGCGKTLMQLLLLRYVVNRWGSIIRHVVVLDTHPELYPLIRQIMSSDGIISYRILTAPEKAHELGLVLNTTSPNLVVLQEANSLNEEAMKYAARAALTSGIPLTLTTYAEMPAVLSMSNAMEVAFGAISVISRRLGDAAAGLTPTICMVYPSALWIWEVYLNRGKSGDAFGVRSLTRVEKKNFSQYGEFEVPVPNLEAIDLGTAGKYTTDFLNSAGLARR